jgi:hypothetical protein
VRQPGTSSSASNHATLWTPVEDRVGGAGIWRRRGSGPWGLVGGRNASLALKAALETGGFRASPSFTRRSAAMRTRSTMPRRLTSEGSSRGVPS